MSARARLGLLGAASFLSGAAAIAFEVLWVRRLGELFGHSAWAVQVVLAIFFLGLGLGAWLLGRAADRWPARAVRLYVALELAIALLGALFLPASDLIEAAYLALGPAEWPLGRALAVKAGLSALLLLPPTIAMGGTLPALVRHVVRREGELAPRLGWLYGTNTLGAAVAALGAIGALAAFGLVAAVAIAASANVAAALLAAWAARGAADEPAATPEGAPAADGGSRALLAGTAFVAGFAGVGFEVLWTRALAARFLNTVYSFATILAAYLLALGIGALVTGALDRAGRLSRRTAVATLGGAGLAALVSVRVWTGVPPVADAVAAGEGLARAQALELAWALAVMAPALLLLGLNLPVVVRLASRGAGRVGRDLGSIWLANTAGSVLAPLLVGFVLLPRLGVRWTMLATAWGAVLFAAFALVPWSGLRRASAAQLGLVGAAVLATLLAPADARLWAKKPGDVLVHWREGLLASVAVVDRADGDRALELNRGYALGTRRTRFAQARQGLLPLVLHGGAERALVLGLGTGSTAGAMAAWGDLSLDVLEIVPELRETLPFFADVNEGLAVRLESDPRVRLLAVDARHFARATELRYDVVVGDLFVPWRAGEGGMFTREHFAAVRGLLAEGGLFCQWLPLYQLRPEDLRVVTATFLDVFPDARLVWLYFNAVQPVAGLVGGAAPGAFDVDVLAARLADSAHAALLGSAGLDEPAPIAASDVAGPEALREWSAGAPLETTAHPRIELGAPARHLARATSEAEESLAAVLELWEAEPLPPTAPETVRAHRLALQQAFRGLAALHHRNDPEAAIRHLTAARSATPEWSWITWSLEQAERALDR